MKIWITKWALTKGITTAEAEVKEGDSMAVVRRPGYVTLRLFGPEWHTTAREALEQAEKMRACKLLSLEKQMNKLCNMRFTAPE